MLELDGLCVGAGDFILSDVGLVVERGEYCVLLGPTGAGKSLLLETICGLTRPSSGAVRWAGTDLTPLPPEARPVSIVFQEAGLFPHLTVAGNIGYGLRVAGVPPDARAERVRKLAVMVGVEPLLGRNVRGLSGGEKQRVALARALAVEPELLLLDEPLSALDTGTSERLQEELRRLHLESDVTVVHVTHDRDVALALADRVAVLLDQRLFRPLAPEELFRRPRERAVAEFLGLKNVLEVRSPRAGACDIGGRELRASGIDEHTRALWLRPDMVELRAEPCETDGICWPVEVLWQRLLGARSEVRVATAEGLELVVVLAPSEVERLGVERGASLHLAIPSESVHTMAR